MIPVKIEPASNAADFSQSFQIILDDGSTPDLSAHLLEASATDARGSNFFTGSTATGAVVVSALGEFSVLIPRTTMAAAKTGAASLSIRASIDGSSEQLFSAFFNIYDGGFSS